MVYSLSYISRAAFSHVKGNVHRSLGRTQYTYPVRSMWLEGGRHPRAVLTHIWQHSALQFPGTEQHVCLAALSTASDELATCGARRASAAAVTGMQQWRAPKPVVSKTGAGVLGRNPHTLATHALSLLAREVGHLLKGVRSAGFWVGGPSSILVWTYRATVWNAAT